jgi:hypothetical protein
MENMPLKEWWAPPGQMKYLVLQGANDQIASPEKWRTVEARAGSASYTGFASRPGHLLLVTEPERPLVP